VYVGGRAGPVSTSRRSRVGRWITSAPIDASGARRYPRSRRAIFRGFGTLAAIGVVACSPSGPARPELPPIDGAEFAAALQAQTRLDAPVRVVFAWSLFEGRQGARTGGQGVARAEPPYRARLDLFLSSGETAARAILIDDDLHLPGSAPDGMVPPPHLLWAALGVFRPGTDAALLGARGTPGGTVELRYGYPGGQELRYTIDGDRIREVQLLQRGSALHSVTLLGNGNGGYPREATYRNVAEFRELKLTTESIEHVASYPPEIWSPLR